MNIDKILRQHDSNVGARLIAPVPGAQQLARSSQLAADCRRASLPARVRLIAPLQVCAWLNDFVQIYNRAPTELACCVRILWPNFFSTPETGGKQA